MSRFFHARESARPEDVIPHLAKQEFHWRKGCSAYELAHSWVTAEGIPASVRSVLDTCPDYADVRAVRRTLRLVPGCSLTLIEVVHAEVSQAVLEAEHRRALRGWQWRRAA